MAHKSLASIYVISIYLSVVAQDTCIKNGSYVNRECKFRKKGVFCECTNLPDPFIVSYEHDIVFIKRAFAFSLLKSLGNFTWLTNIYISRCIFNGGLEGLLLSNFSDLEVLEISHSSLKEINTTLPENSSLKSIDFSYNLLKNLPPKIFAQQKVLEDISFHYNELDSIKRDNFIHNSKLKLLDLSFNRIRNIENKAFSFLQEHNCVVLNLSHNLLNRIDNFTFENSSALNVFDLSYNNFHSISKMAFKGLKKLRFLSLANNKIKNLPLEAFSTLKSLQELYLDGNRIKMLGKGVFEGLPLLKDLWLSHNRMECIDPIAFQGLSELRTLHLEDNWLRQIPKIPPGVLELHFSRNYLRCLDEYSLQKTRGLQLLDLEGNFICHINQRTFKFNRNLTFLKLHGNKNLCLSGNVFDGLKALQTLFLDSRSKSPNILNELSILKDLQNVTLIDQTRVVNKCYSFDLSFVVNSDNCQYLLSENKCSNETAQCFCDYRDVIVREIRECRSGEHTMTGNTMLLIITLFIPEIELILIKIILIIYSILGYPLRFPVRLKFATRGPPSPAMQIE